MNDQRSSRGAVDGEKPPVPLRLQAVTAGVCLAVLVALAWHFDFGRTQTVFQSSWRAPGGEHGASLVSPEPAAARHARYSEPFEIDRATTVAVDIARSPAAGALLVASALVDLGRGETREVVLESRWEIGPEGEPEGALEDAARFVRVEPGTYMVRFEPDWHGAGDPAAPAPELRVQVTAGGRSPAPFATAAALLVAPVTLSAMRSWRLRRRRT